MHLAIQCTPLPQRSDLTPKKGAECIGFHLSRVQRLLRSIANRVSCEQALSGYLYVFVRMVKDDLASLKRTLAFFHQQVATFFCLPS